MTVYHIVRPWADVVLGALRSKLLRDPAWRAGALPNADEAQLEVLLRALAEEARALDVHDVVSTPKTSRDAVKVEDRFVRRASTGAIVEASGFVTLSVIEEGIERRTTVEMSDVHRRASRLLDRGARSVAELAAQTVGLEIDGARELVTVLLDAGFVRPCPESRAEDAK